MRTRIVTTIALIGFLVSAFALVGAAPASVLAAEQDEATFKVDLNRAGVEELVKLPGVGQTVAARIVKYREENGPFASPEEIMNVRGIGEKTFLKLEPHLTVSPSKNAREQR